MQLLIQIDLNLIEHVYDLIIYIFSHWDYVRTSQNVVGWGKRSIWFVIEEQGHQRKRDDYQEEKGETA